MCEICSGSILRAFTAADFIELSSSAFSGKRTSSISFIIIICRVLSRRCNKGMKIDSYGVDLKIKLTDMKKIIFTVIGFFAVLSLSSCGYNSMVQLDEQVTAQWGQVENVYQRRADLIPNLVASVKGAANFEQKTLT